MHVVEDRFHTDDWHTISVLVVALHQLTHHHEAMSQTQEDPAQRPGENEKEVHSTFIPRVLLQLY